MTSLLRFATAGSVDDGKSTLVGRLLYDSKTILADQLEAVEWASRERGREDTDLALLTDGLRAEREQGITIDVAYRYFATSRRRFILADTPGHVQYTRNMVTGASTADLVLILVDARKGIVAQTRRHAAIAALLRVPRVVLAVNKMDLVDWSEEAFAAIAREFAELVADLGIGSVTSIPVSGLTGDNVVTPTSRMPWYRGETIMELLESVEVEQDAARAPARFPVQYVIRNDGRRYYAGQLSAGGLTVGERVVVLPSGTVTAVEAIDALGEQAAAAWAPQSVALRLSDELDVSRGDLIAEAEDPPVLASEFRTTICHLHERPLELGEEVVVKHATRTVPGVVTDIVPRTGLADLTCRPGARTLEANEIAGVALRTFAPLPVDLYAQSRTTGACLLIDPADGATRAAGIIESVPA
ncbi:sulfate adenylyltransferase subunit 1 [Spirillospora sp. NPDC048911]|uniref:sulfate adenylyltransferase subunit 1 n=1 Tax=Spirillospora sp. NPDC048911 TaxID=3364527 RepID=UPI003713005A